MESVVSATGENERLSQKEQPVLLIVPSRLGQENPALTGILRTGQPNRFFIIDR
jgi:hypothetical protein